MTTIKLSVIIPTSGRSIFLKDALDSITMQTLSKDLYEIIVVENGSKDDTEKVVKEYQSKLDHLSYIYEPQPGLHCGRHAGYRAAKGDILVYADDDIIAFPTWLEGVYESFRDEAVVLVGGKCLPKFEGNVPFWILEKWYKMGSVGRCMMDLSLLDAGDDTKEIEPYMIYGCNYSIRKRILDETHGFHPDGVPFESIQYRGDGETYVNRYIESKGYKALYNPKASVYHRVPISRMTIDYFKKRAFCDGVEASYAEKRYGIITPCTPVQTKNIAQRIKNRIKELFKLLRMTDMEKDIEKSRQRGYDFHHYMYMHDSHLREWVEKENYLE